jgi:hypothetical protein
MGKRALVPVRAYIELVNRLSLRSVAGVRMEPTMPRELPQQPSLIMIQFLTWIADRPRNYAQTMDAWRSSCPRLSVWEDAIIEGLIRIESNANRSIRLTPQGVAVLARSQQQTQPQMSGTAPRRAPKANTKISGKAPAVAHAAAF